MLLPKIRLKYCTLALLKPYLYGITMISRPKVKVKIADVLGKSSPIATLANFVNSILEVILVKIRSNDQKSAKTTKLKNM